MLSLPVSLFPVSVLPVSSLPVSLLPGSSLPEVFFAIVKLVLAEPSGTSFRVKLLGGTDDLNAGQAIDRTGVRLGISFPCGKALDELSQRSSVSFGKIPVSVNGLSCSLSGLENKTNDLIEKNTPPEDVASFLFEYLSRVLLRLTENLRECCGDLPILFAGGVMANTRIRENLSKQKNIFFASPALSSDNACGVGLLARERYERILRGLSLS